MRLNFILILIVFYFFNAFAQNEDQTWIGGYYGYVDPDTSSQFFVFSLKFKENGEKVFSKFNKSQVYIRAGNAAICDSSGNMIIFTNGQDIYNKNMEPMKGSDSLNFTPPNNPDYQSAYMQNSIILPYPNKKKRYIVVYQERGPVNYLYQGENYITPATIKTYYCIVDMNSNNALGEIIERKRIITSDTLSTGRLQAVRHGNGRDWWIVTQKFASNIYYKYLLDSSGIHLKDKQAIGLDDFASLGQNVFSPDGNYFVNFDITGFSVHSCLFNFDRCSGLLSNPRYINFPDYKPCGGAAVSPNSRYLYINRYDTLYQFDLKAQNLWASKQVVGIFDGFNYKNIFSTGMFNMQLAHDGKIYIATQGATPYMHIIHNPDKPGVLCNFELRGLKLPSYHLRSVPNYPNFKLGALKGSTCDTLGLGVATKDIEKEDIKIFPNPAQDILNIEIIAETLQSIDFQLFNIQGALLKKQTISSPQQAIDISDLSNGMYFIEIRQAGKVLKKEKIVVLRE